MVYSSQNTSETYLAYVAVEREICEYTLWQRYWGDYTTNDVCWALIDAEVHHQTAT